MEGQTAGLPAWRNLRVLPFVPFGFASTAGSQFAVRGLTMTTFNTTATQTNLAERLDQQEAEWQKRKVRRLARALHLDTRALGDEIRGFYGCEVERSDLQVTVRIAEQRAIRLALRASFDADGELRQSYHVEDRQIQRGIDYEERDMEYRFPRLREAVARFEALCRAALKSR